VSISINPAGSVPSLGDGVNLRLAAQIASAAVVGAALNDLGASGGPAGAPDAGRGGTPGQVPGQAGKPGLPTLPAQPIAAGATRGIDRLGIQPEDWFESSLPAERASGINVNELAEPAQLIHASLVHAELKVLDGGLNTGAIALGQPLNINGVDSRAIPLQLLAASATAEAVGAKTALEWRQPERSGIKLEDQLMGEIPLLFAPVPIEPQERSIGLRFKAVVVNGMLMLGAVLAVILVTTLNLKDLPSIQMTVLGALAIVGALCLTLRWARARRG
jgi:hypothetical protein